MLKVYDGINDVPFLFFLTSIIHFMHLKVLQEETTANMAAGGSSAKRDYSANYI